MRSADASDAPLPPPVDPSLQKALVKAGVPLEEFSEKPGDYEAQPVKEAKFASYAVGQFLVAWCEVENELFVAEILDKDPLDEFVLCRTWGSYDSGKPLKDRQWYRAWYSPKDKTAVFKNTSKNPAWDPWLWKVLPEDVRSLPFDRLVKRRLPVGLSVEGV